MPLSLLPVCLQIKFVKIDIDNPDLESTVKDHAISGVVRDGHTHTHTLMYTHRERAHTHNRTRAASQRGNTVSALLSLD